MKILMLMLACTGILCAADTRPADFFPLAPGSSWTYRTAEIHGRDSFEMNVIMEEPETDKGQTYHILTQKDKRGTMRSFLEVTDQGVYVKKTSVRKSYTPALSAVHEPAIPLFVFNIEPGHTFHWEGVLKIAFIDKDIVLNGTVAGIEEITVPAGIFECVKLHFRKKEGKTVTDEYAWYAKGVGQVKYTGGQYTKELTVYHIAE